MAEPLEQKQYRLLIISGIVAVVLMIVFYILFLSDTERRVLMAISLFWWLILPIPVWMVFNWIWEDYSALMYWVVKQKFVLLEIKLPAEIEKSPKLMESFFDGLHTFSTPNLFEKYCGWRPLQDKFTAEIVSTEGVVHFYIRCPKGQRNNVEAQIYAQYPDAEIFEVEDYTKKLPFNLPNKDYDVWGSILMPTAKEGTKNAYPIRTYTNFIEDVTGKMHDPMGALVETMSSLGPGQHVWFQIVFTPAAEKDAFAESKGVIKKMKEELSKRKVGDASDSLNINFMTPDELDVFKAVNSKIAKVPFWGLLRFVYVGKRENYNKALGVAGVMGAIKQFADNNLNGLYPDPESKTFANYYFVEPRLTYRQRKIIQNYRDRDMVGKRFFYNTEELATLFHFPDMSVRTPNLQRVTAKKGEAPPNLPVEFMVE